MNEKKIYPVLPLRDIVVFPHMAVPLFIGRVKSVKSVSVAMESNKMVILVAQIDQANEDPFFKDVYRIGVIGKIMQLLQLPDGTAKVLIEGIKRVKILDFDNDGDYYRAEYEEIEETELQKSENSDNDEALKRALLYQLDQYTRFNRKISVDVLKILKNTNSVERLVDIISAYLIMTLSEKQEILEILDINKRVERILSIMESEIDVLNAERRIKNRVKKQIEKNQREYYLNEQMKAIQKELGEDFDEQSEIVEFEANIKKVKLTKEAKEKVQHELKRLKGMPPMSAESSVIRNYIDLVLSLPWDYKTSCKNDLKEARKVLDRDHYGFEKIKERIIEFLAVQGRVGKTKGQILCLVGPPGVGKTSLAKSIAEATNRNYVRISLGGVRDESEIRGHRRTYIGSMPGKIIQGMKKAKSSNPLMLLDEIDKLGADWRGDPASALLEVLDSEQNENFNDHYLEVGYDLSNVMFIATANTLKMPQPLLDRLEIVRISGYTEFEKLEIARQYLFPKQMVNHKLSKDEFVVDDDVLMFLIRNYTRESGVRSLEREIINLTRKAVREITEYNEKSEHEAGENDESIVKKSKKKATKKVDDIANKISQALENDSKDDLKHNLNMDLKNNAFKIDLDSSVVLKSSTQSFKNKSEKNTYKVHITLENVEKYAGIPKYRYGEIENVNMIGIVNGLAWTEVGGEILSIEAVKVAGKGKVTLTGKLGDVIQESIQASLSFVRSKADLFGVNAEVFEKNDFHIHMPEGATPKDGPSAGVAMVVAIISVLTNVPVKFDVAMTGEITLRGRILPIGGLKEKLLAALRGGIKTVIIPFDNEKDLHDVPDTIKGDLKIIPVKNIDEVFSVVFDGNIFKGLEAATAAAAMLTKSGKPISQNTVV